MSTETSPAASAPLSNEEALALLSERDRAVEAAAEAQSLVDRAGAAVGSIRVPEFVLFFLLISGFGPLPVGTYSYVIVLPLLVAMALLRRPTVSLRSREFLLPLFAVGLFYIFVVSLFGSQDPEIAADWKGRFLKFAVFTAAMMVIASGRVDMRSGFWGMTAALALNVPLFYLGLVPATYGKYLTGFLGDKNVSGLTYCIVGVMAVHFVQRRWLWVLTVLGFAGALWLTGSRTSLAAFAAAIGWILLAPYLPVVGRWVYAGIIALIVNVISEDYSQVGVFSDREGSDLLRARIDEAAELKAANAGFFGNGLGDAVLEMEGRTWFFHSSYLTALVEGGWPWLLFVVGITVLIMIQPFKNRVTRGELFGQALGVALLICAWRLGEVFYTHLWAISMGIAIHMQARALMGKNDESDEDSPDPDQHGDAPGSLSLPKALPGLPELEKGKHA